MVVKHERSVADIRESLRRLLEFFSCSESHKTDPLILSGMESDLIRMETQLKMFCGYRGGKNAQNNFGVQASGSSVVDLGD